MSSPLDRPRACSSDQQRGVVAGGQQSAEQNRRTAVASGAGAMIRQESGFSGADIDSRSE
jgi:hypothetical protein